MLLTTPRLWVCVRLQLALTQELEYEISVNPIEKVMLEQQIMEKLADMMGSVIISMHTLEEQAENSGGYNPYIEDVKKNMIS